MSFFVALADVLETALWLAWWAALALGVLVLLPLIFVFCWFGSRAVRLVLRGEWLRL